MSNVVQLTTEQLEAVIQQAVSAALASRQPKAAKPVDPAKQERAEKYLQSKKDTALRLAREKGQHYYVCRKGRKLLVWGEETRAAAKRRGQNPDETLGTPVFNTYEGGFRLYMVNRG